MFRLLSLDRLPGNELVMTRELIANMLDVQRERVTEGATKLQRARLIRYARGRITVIDRLGLEHRVWECYAVVNTEYDRLLPIREAALRSLQILQCTSTAQATPSRW